MTITRNPGKVRVSKWVFTPHTPWIVTTPNGRMIYTQTWREAMNAAERECKP